MIMRKLFLYLLAAFLLTSCDNLKSKDSKSDEDTEETSTKKKKKVLDEDEESNTDEEEETPKKKKKSVSEDDELTDVTDDKEDSNVDETKGWSKADEKKWMDDCTSTAEPRVGFERANSYCSCMMEKAKQEYSSFDAANRGITQAFVDKYAPGCNNQ